MAIEAFLDLRYDDYATLDNNVLRSIELTELEAAIALSLLTLANDSSVWDVSGSQLDDILASVADLLEAIGDA